MQPRRFVDRYELERRLGRGGMAEVWRARDLRLDRPVAVKILDRSGLTDPAMIERFRREARAVARIAHPNIVAAYDYGADDGKPYLVMEMVEGRTLDELLAAGPLPVRQAVQVATQACAALDAAHHAGVIHRDVKPGNLIVTADGTVKVLDFGIARLQDTAQEALTRTATVIGTSHYMAPEQAAGGTADARTDLYALGCVLYAMLTGSPPFRGENPMSVLYQHLHASPRPVREHRPEVPAGLDQLVSELLAKDPAERPPTASVLGARLRALASRPSVTSVLPAGASTPQAGALLGRAVVSPPASPPPTEFFPEPAPESQPRRRRPRRVGVYTAAALGAVVLLILVLASLPDGERPVDSGQPPATTAASSGSPSTTRGPTATDPAGRLAELRALAIQQAAADEINAEAARELDEEIDKIAEDLQKGEPDKAARRVAELRDTLNELVREGHLTPAARDNLATSLERLAQALPQPHQRRDGGDGEDGRRGKGNDKD